MTPERKRPRATLADVAARAGVSVTTVSFVLNGRRDMRVSTPTANRVLEAARVLNYGRRVQHRATFPRGLPVVGFISDTVASDHYAGEMIRGAIAAAADRGYGLFIAESTGARPFERGVVQDLVARGIEHFVYAAMSTRVVKVPEDLTERRLVLLNCVSRRPARQAVVPDERSAGALAASTLIDAGHTDAIWLVGEVRGAPYAGRDRHASIAAQLASQGLSLAAHLPCKWWPPDAREAVAAALASGNHPRPTAMIAMNDRVALGIYQAAGAAGLRVPEDLSVISFDNSDLAWWLYPGLTSLGLPYFDMGRRAIEVLLDPSATPETESMPMPLHVRDSIGSPRLPDR